MERKNDIIMQTAVSIIEIQTRQFNKLRDKITYLLSLNKYRINIVYPVFTKKMIYNIDGPP